MKRYGMIGINGKKIPINDMIRNVFWNKWKRGFKVNYGEIKKCDIANGEGVRVALFVSGCRHHCKGCFNSMTWDFNYGKKFTKETEEEKAEKARVMEIVLKDACSVPMEIMEKCCEAIELIVEFGAKGSKLAISDAGVGAAFCKAALQGASLNVYINTKSMADREYAEELNRKADAMLEKYTKIADDTFNSVLGRLK